MTERNMAQAEAGNVKTVESPLLALGDQCEQATGPDRELDARIFNAASEQMERWNRRALKLPLEKRRSRYDDGWVHVYAGKGEDDPYAEDLPRYTASLDAAMTLLDESWFFHVSRFSPESGSRGQAHVYPNRGLGDDYESEAATPALSLCAAALRARAA